MNTFWLKIAAFVIAVVVGIVVVTMYMPHGPQEPQQPEKTFYDMADRDKQFNEKPQLAQEPAQPAEEQTPQPATEPQTQAQPPAQPAPEPAQPPAVQTPAVILPSAITKPTTLYFKPMSEDDDIAAQELLPYATTGRSLGRLPVLQYGLMVKACRQIEERWPDSWYAFRAKQLLEEIFERYAANYKITPQELDITRFLKPGKGTEARTVEPVRR